jgi:DNA modification methylase
VPESRGDRLAWSSASSAYAPSSKPSPELRPIVDLPPMVVHRRLSAIDWRFEGSRADDGPHGLVPFPAKFVPDIPRRIIQLLSLPEDVVLDPFVGSGTTHVEALQVGRRAISIDASAWAELVTRVKSTHLTATDQLALRDYARSLASKSSNDLRSSIQGPDIPNVDKWYDPAVFQALAGIRELALALHGRPRAAALVALAQVASRSSYQESETRYVAKAGARDPDLVRMEVVRETLRALDLLSSIPAAWRERSAVVLGDSMTEVQRLAPGSAGLVVTSPPYPNSFDYHLYQRFKLFWIGADPRDLRAIEIGSHLRHQGRPDAADVYVSEMSAVLTGCWQALMPGRYVALVVGSGIYSGSELDTAEVLATAARKIGFAPLPPIARVLPSARRAVAVGRRLASEELVLLYKPRETTPVEILLPNYRLQPYEEQLARLEVSGVAALPFGVEKWPSVEVEGGGVQGLSQLGFAHGYRTSAGDTRTTQFWLEGAPPDGLRRKNSNYLSHGIHDFKGKFYPQLARSLINASGLRPGSVVLDPFGGSGTTALESVLQGHTAFSIDCNPLSAAVTQAKVDSLRIDPAELRAVSTKLIDSLPEPSSLDTGAFGRSNPLARRELESWFAPPIIAKLDRLLGWIDETCDGPIKRVLEMTTSDIIRSVSQQEPKDLRIRRRKVPLVDAPVFELFADRVDDLIAQMRAGWPTVQTARLGEFHSILGDASRADAYRLLDLAEVQVDAVVTSPPYASALPYVDTDRLSLAGVLGVGSRERREIEDRLIGSRELTRTKQTSIHATFDDPGAEDLLPESTRTFIVNYRAAVRADRAAGFRLNGGPAVLIQYFSKIARTLRELKSRMAPGSSCWIVVGDSHSRVAGERWCIPTVAETAAIGSHVGFALAGRIPIDVSRADVLHSRHTITLNEIVHLVA